MRLLSAPGDARRKHQPPAPSVRPPEAISAGPLAREQALPGDELAAPSRSERLSSAIALPSGGHPISRPSGDLLRTYQNLRGRRRVSPVPGGETSPIRQPQNRIAPFRRFRQTSPGEGHPKPIDSVLSTPGQLAPLRECLRILSIPRIAPFPARPVSPHSMGGVPHTTCSSRSPLLSNS